MTDLSSITSHNDYVELLSDTGLVGGSLADWHSCFYWRGWIEESHCGTKCGEARLSRSAPWLLCFGPARTFDRGF